MLHLIIGWALVVLGLVDIVFAVRAWFDGSVYLPEENLAAIVAGVVAVLWGALLIIFGPREAIGVVLLVGGVIGATVGWLAHRYANLDDTRVKNPPIWPALIGLAVAIGGAAILLV
jgi:hypothetical protein